MGDQNFGSNVEGEEESVRVPADWRYGSAPRAAANGFVELVLTM